MTEREISKVMDCIISSSHGIGRELEDEVENMLKKQIPKKPNICDETKKLWHCPSCGDYYGSLKVNYCNNCGQRIDWSEVEE